MLTSVGMSVLLGDDERGELVATVGIDVQASGGAPLGEFIGVNHNPFHDVLLAAEVALAVLRGLEPFVERVVQSIAVYKDGIAEPVVILSAIPGHS